MKSLLLAILIACFILVITAEGNLAFKTCSTYGYCLPENYSKHKLPLRPIIIDTKIKIKQLTEILDKQGTVELLAVFDMTWNDNQIVIEPALSDPEWHYEEWHEKIWQPDLYFYGMKDIDVHGFQHLKYMMFRIYNCTSTRTCVNKYEEVKITIWCSMDFSSYPFDVQVCSFYMGSVTKESHVMEFNLKQLTMKQSTVELQGMDINLAYSSALKSVEMNLTFDGYNQFYSVVGFKLKLERYFMQFILSYYFPSFVFVVVSWASFLIPPDVIPGRMALLITLMLVLVNLYGTIIRTQPPSNSPTLLAIWTFTCIMFVTGALFAYAIILWQKRKSSHNTSGKNTNAVKPTKKVPAGNSYDKSEKHENILEMKGKDWDGFCLMVFPSAFMIFNLIYWPVVYAEHMTSRNSF